MRNTAFSFVGLPVCPVLAMGVDGLSMARSDSPDKTGKNVL
jgi:hypothetical protein